MQSYVGRSGDGKMRQVLFLTFILIITGGCTFVSDSRPEMAKQAQSTRVITDVGVAPPQVEASAASAAP